MNIFLWSFSSFRLFKKGGGQLQVGVCARSNHGRRLVKLAKENEFG